MVFPEVGAGTEHGVVGLVLVEFLEVRAEHPDGGIEPLEGRQDIDQEHFYGVSIGDVRLFMGKDGFVRDLPVFPGQDDIFHPAERVDVPLGDENPAAVLFPDRFGLADAGNIYGRLTNSTQGVFEDRIAALEGGVAGLAVASGAAAITYVIEALAVKGEHIVAQKTIYGGSENLLAHTLPLYGIETTFVNIHDLDEVKAAIRPNTKALYIETLGNPSSDIPDIEALAKIAHEAGIPLVIDNTFGTPYLIRPIEYGADIVVHSATKFIGGHGTTLGGVIVDSGNFDWAASGKYPWISEPNPSYHGVKFTDAAGNSSMQ